MSSEGDKESSHQPTPPPTTQNLLSQNLSFSINDILSNNHDVNDSSFQSIVQTLSNNNNNDNITPSYAHLPVELQDLFNSNETDDLLSEQGTADASMLGSDMWSGTPISSQLSSQPFMSSPNIQLTPSPKSIQSSPTAIQTPVLQLQTTPLMQQPIIQTPIASHSPSSKEPSPKGNHIYTEI
jgi:hypothetical protein